VAATLIWGGTFVILRDTVPRIRPLALVFTRFLVAALVIGGTLALKRRTLIRGPWLGGALSGLCAAGEYLAQAIGLTSTSAGSSAFLTCFATPLAALFAWPLLGERPSGRLLVGLAAALAGVSLITVQQRLALGVGELWTLLGAALFGLQVVVLARAAPGADPLRLTGIQSAVVALVLLPWAPAALRDLAGLSGADLARLAYLAIPATVIAPWLQIRAQRTLPAGRIGLLFVLEPLFALGFAIAFGDERFAPRWWVGAALIASAVLIVEGRTLAPAPAARRASA
jgi:drug/metabolite transporter (DMT)-like permease